jgi:ATP-dependent helicase/nuclease subunit A
MNEPARKSSALKTQATDLLPEDAQHAASDPKHSVWVSASAGSGKTAVLTARVLRLLLADVKPERILCLTFTRAAAAEMAIRITARLGFWATCTTDALRDSIAELQGYASAPEQLTQARRLLTRVLNCPGGLRIRTIHAFAQEILRRFPIEAGVPPHFTVIAERDGAELAAEALHDLMREAVAAPESASARALRMLAATLGDGGLQEALDAILSNRARLLAAAEYAGSVEKLIAQQRAQLLLKPDDTPEKIRAHIVSQIPETDIHGAAQKLLNGTGSFKSRGEEMRTWFALSKDQRAARFDDYCRFFLTGSREAFAKFANKDLLAKHPELDDVLRREAERLIASRARLETVEIAEGSAALITLGLDLARRADALKSRRAALDYDDLIMKADDLLRRPGIAPWVLYKLDGGLDHILVDEAQDTSAAQWNIVSALADEFFAGASARADKNRTLFVVGDEKQSIFSFQHADPEAFARMRDVFARRVTDAGKSWREEALNFSFRSAPAILRAVDALFANPAARAGVAHEPVRHFAAPVRIGDAPKVGRIEVWPLIEAPEKSSREAWSTASDYDLERDREAELAAKIADKIRSLCAQTLPGRGRPIAPGDIMILLRRRGRFADLMVRALKSRKIAVTGVDRMRLVKQLPVMDMLALLQFALLPEDDLNLAALLRSPLLGINEDDLMELCIGRKGTLWQSLKAKTASGNADGPPTYPPPQGGRDFIARVARSSPPPLAGGVRGGGAPPDSRFAVARNYLEEILARADFTPPFAFLSSALNQPCPGDVISGRRALWARLGPDALDPIDELLSAALEFDMQHPPSLQEFLRWLTSADTEIKRELDQGGKENGKENWGQVRIMTVHAAKGLEAPIVFLPDAAGLPRAQDVPEILWSGETPFYLPRKPTTGLQRELWEEARRKQMEEYRRLFYVALTRASHRLYIAGWEPARNEGNAEMSWHALALDALQPLHEAHAIAVRDQNPPLIVFEDAYPDTAPPKTEKTKTAAKPSLPAWITKPAPEEAAIARPLSPSALAAPPISKTPDAVFARGRIIHRLLQSLPDVEAVQRAPAASRFLANPQHGLTPLQQKEIADEVLKLLSTPDYAPLFGPGSRAEVPLAGPIDGQPIAGQVDRLCVRENDIWIVDYKTGAPPANALEIPDAYRKQLSTYRVLLMQIYPKKPVRCFLLWTSGPKLMEITDFS